MLINNKIRKTDNIGWPGRPSSTASRGTVTAERLAPRYGSEQGQRWYQRRFQHVRAGGAVDSTGGVPQCSISKSRISRWSAARDGDKQQLSQNKFLRVHQPRVVQHPHTSQTLCVCDPVGDSYPIYSCFGRGKGAADRDLLRNPKNPDSIREMIPGRAQSQSETL